MYSYYALAALGPQVRKYLWWKKYLTQMQLGQFIFGMVYGTIMIFLQTGYPTIWFWFGFCQSPLFFFMFYNFYQKSYNNTTNNNNNELKSNKSLANKVE